MHRHIRRAERALSLLHLPLSPTRASERPATRGSLPFAMRGLAVVVALAAGASAQGLPGLTTGGSLFVDDYGNTYTFPSTVPHRATMAGGWSQARTSAWGRTVPTEDSVYLACRAVTDSLAGSGGGNAGGVLTAEFVVAPGRKAGFRFETLVDIQGSGISGAAAEVQLDRWDDVSASWARVVSIEDGHAPGSSSVRSSITTPGKYRVVVRTEAFLIPTTDALATTLATASVWGAVRSPLALPAP